MSDLANGDLKWFSYTQNNSGGYYIRNEVVSENIFIQADSAIAANNKAYEITEDFGEYCECCGSRWYIDADEDDGYAAPSLYGKSIYANHDRFTSEGILHYFDGQIEKVTYPKFIHE